MLFRLKAILIRVILAETSDFRRFWRLSKHVQAMGLGIDVGCTKIKGFHPKYYYKSF